MLRKIDRLVMRVPSLPGAVTYYTEVLGLKLVRRDERLATLRFADDSADLILHTDPDLPANAVYYLVDDVRDLYARRREIKLTFTGPPARVARGYRATVKDPFGNFLMLLDRCAQVATAHDGENPCDDPADAAAHEAKMPEDVRVAGTLFVGMTQRFSPKRELLIHLYEQVGRTADDLPYTPEFERLYLPYAAAFSEPHPERAEVWRHLLGVRKAGKLPKLGDAKSRPPDIAPESRELLKKLIGPDLGKRDRLPYTARFDEIADGFNRTEKRALSPHLVWRLIATMAK